MLAHDGVERAKFRTGPYTVPTPEALARAIAAAVRAGVRFKLTGGLHHALPGHDRESGQHHHGFLNALAATSLAIDGAAEDAIAGILRAGDPDQVLSALHASPAGEVRDRFCSFGSCSVDEPFAELVRLGLQMRHDLTCTVVLGAWSRRVGLLSCHLADGCCAGRR